MSEASHQSQVSGIRVLTKVVFSLGPLNTLLANNISTLSGMVAGMSRLECIYRYQNKNPETTCTNNECTRSWGSKT